MDLEELRAFLNVVDAGSFLAAADSLGLSRTTLKRRIDGLEARAGVRLLENTPRGVVVSEAGRVLAERGRVMVAEVSVLVSSLRKIGTRPEGLLKVVLPVGMPPHLLTPLLRMIRSEHPELRASARFSNDPLAEPVEDVEIAVHFGMGAPRGSWISHELRRVRVWLLAAREYIQARGMPLTIDDLQQHELLAWRGPGIDPNAWPTLAGSTFNVLPALESTDIHLLRSACIAGLGVTLVPDAMVPDPGLPEGSLMGVLAAIVGRDIPLCISVPAVLADTPKVKMVLEHTQRFLDLQGGPHSSGLGGGGAG